MGIRQRLRPIVFLAIPFFGLSSCSREDGSGFGRSRFSPDGSMILFSFGPRGWGDLYTMKLDGTALKRLTETPDRKGDPAFSPDGGTIVYASTPLGGNGSQIFRIDADGGNLRQLTQNEHCDLSPSYSPDGTKVCFLRAHAHRPYSMGGWTWDDWDLYIMESDVTGEKRITFGKHYGMDPPHFTPDGRRILYAADIDGVKNHEVLIVDAQGKNLPVGLTQGIARGTLHYTTSADPSISPDGARIAFISNRVSRTSPYDYEIWIMNVDGTDPRQVTHNQSCNTTPVFSPDGDWILFRSDKSRDGRSELWRVDTDGKGLSPIARTLPMAR